MSAPLTHMAFHGLWMLLGTVALVLLVLGLLRALFPDFSASESNAPGSVQPERSPPGAAQPATCAGGVKPSGRG